MPLALLVAAPSVERFAIVIGENRAPDPTTETLVYADDDAIMMHELLKELGVRSTLLVAPDDDTRTLFKGQLKGVVAPELSTLRAALERTFMGIKGANAQGAKTELFFFYSGHGDIKEGEAFVTLNKERLTRHFLAEEVLGRSPANQNHVIIDACKSHFLVFNKGTSASRTPYQRPLQDVRQRFRNTGFVLSTSSDRDSHEWARWQGGIFSHEIRSGLRGGADLDGDHSVSYAELGAFVKKANSTVSNVLFRSDARLYPPLDRVSAEDTALVTWSSTVSAVRIPAGSRFGHIYLQDSQGVRIADAHPDLEHDLQIFTPPRRPLFVRSASLNTEFEVRTSTCVVVVPPDAFGASAKKVKIKGAAHIAFSKLFAEPFGARDLERYREAILADQRLALVTAQPSLDWTDKTRKVAPWLALGLGLFGGAMTTSALITWQRTKMEDLAVKERANQQIRALNVVALTSYITAGAALFTWLMLQIFEEEP